jgi:peptidoglycan hydrolase-like protein with peptidoglycan-binding domain
VLLASLTLAAGGALAQDQTGGGAAKPAAAKTASVADIQGALGIAADGIAGPQTRRALKRFQSAHGLQADGVAGPATLAALGLDGSQDASSQLQSTPAGEAAPADATAALAQIAQCESGGDPTVVSRDGRFRGKYQFTRATWRALGGTGDPAKADEATQDAMAAKLYAERGTAPWPVCGATAA